MSNQQKKIDVNLFHVETAIENFLKHREPFGEWCDEIVTGGTQKVETFCRVCVLGKHIAYTTRTVRNSMGLVRVEVDFEPSSVTLCDGSCRQKLDFLDVVRESPKPVMDPVEAWRAQMRHAAFAGCCGVEHLLGAKEFPARLIGVNQKVISTDGGFYEYRLYCLGEFNVLVRVNVNNLRFHITHCHGSELERVDGFCRYKFDIDFLPDMVRKFVVCL